tara:strand:- start:2796 stop:3662 length:867 start_codon:yes stop_codon:yes gene_type:complete
MTNNKLDNSKMLKTSIDKAFRGGISGGIAMVINICTLMPLRTTVNYQYRYGTTGIQSLTTLYRDGGMLRFYRGFGFAIIQGPWSRFGDTFANSGTMALLNSNESTKDLNVGTKTLLASSTASLFRIISTPIDTCKTILQVEGKSGLKKIGQKFRNTGGFPRGLPILWYGALGSASATFVGHYPWFFTYNYLQKYIPEQETVIGNLSKNAFIGFSASAISDTCSNSIRVLKTYRQTHPLPISYGTSIKEIISNDGLSSLFGRGLKIKIISNGIQGSLFAVLWKYIEKQL